MAQGVALGKVPDVKPIWAQDLDGCMVNMTKTANRILCIEEEPDCWDWVEKHGPDTMEKFKFFLKGGENLELCGEWETMEPITGAIQGITTVSQYFDVVYATHRSTNLTEATEKWLHSNGVYFPVVHGFDKTEVGAKVYVDDNGPTVENILKKTGENAFVFLFDQKWNREYTHLDPYRVSGWDELEELALKIATTESILN